MDQPSYLFFLLPLLLFWIGLSTLAWRSRRLASQKFVDAEMRSRILPPQSRTRWLIKVALQLLAIATAVFAMAGPRFGTEIEEVVPRGSDLYVLIDVSRSMLADDVAPSRLERAKADVESLLNRLQRERVGLIAFAGQAVVKCPLTVDYDSFRRSLKELDTNSAPRGGTAIGDAIRKSLEVFQENSSRDQVILLITDGDDQQSYPLEAAAAAAERKVAVFAIGLGDPNQGSRIPQRPNSGLFVEYEGEQVWSKLDGSVLQDIAVKTSGVYVPAGTKSYDLGSLYQDYLQNRQGDSSESQQRVRSSERFQIPLAICLAAMLLDMVVYVVRRHDPFSQDSQKGSTRNAVVS
jgi:Ca-activated chloride channel homolog